MAQKTNKYGLSRSIPAAIKRKIRSECGYGCVLCGSVIIEYEHIEPEWNDAKEHDPSKMALLCPDHHARVTKGIISKHKIIEARKNPWSFIHGHSYDSLSMEASSNKIKIADNIFEDVDIIVDLNNKPLIWFNEAEEYGAPKRLNALFYDQNGKLISQIINNEFRAFVDGCDVNAQGYKITLNYHRQRINLELEREADEVIQINKLNMFYDGYNFSINEVGDFSIKTPDGSNITLNGCGVKNGRCAFKFGSVPKSKLEKPSDFLIVMLKGEHIYNYMQQHIGYLFNSYIIDKHGYRVGKVQNQNVYNLKEELIGIYKDNGILAKVDEGVYIQKGQYHIRNVLKNYAPDVSYRLLDL